MSSARAILFAIFLAVAIVLVLQHAPRCKPGDRGLYLAGKVLLAGCPR